LKELLCFGIFVQAETLHVPQPALKGSPSIETAWRFAYRTTELGIGNSRSDRNRYRLGDIVLHCEHVGEITVVAFGPEMIASFALYELSGDADPIAGLAGAPLRARSAR
jgi:hypothetical protein